MASTVVSSNSSKQTASISNNKYQKLILYESNSKLVFKKENDSPFSSNLLVSKRDTSELLLSQDSGNEYDDKKYKLTLIDGLIGALKLNAGLYFICCTGKEAIGSIRGLNVWKTTSFRIIRAAPSIDGISTRQASDDIEYIRLVENYLNTKHFYFSYDYDLTNHIGKQPATLLMENCNQKYLYNSFLCNNLVRAAIVNTSSSSTFSGNEDNFRSLGTMDSALIKGNSLVLTFCLPLIQGFVLIQDFSLSSHNLKLSLISRRCPIRSGTRFHCRGIDENGNVANLVETEQILFSADRVFSFIQLRGSIPIYWGQAINLKYKPRLFIGSSSNLSSPISSADSFKNKEALKRHFLSIQALYGRPILTINLVNKDGYERLLGDEFTKIIRAEHAHIDAKYFHFDFHHECKSFGWSRLSDLVSSLKKYFESFGYYELSGDLTNVFTRQSGIVRINCVDCLDRTNVFMGIVGKFVLIRQLKQLNLLPPSANSFGNENGEAIEAVFKNIWADNGDYISEIYTGTGALKSDFTRTGKRTLIGVMNDGYKSLQRYLLNNFFDAELEDASSLLSGGYQVNKGASSPFKKKINMKYYSLLSLGGYFLASFTYGLIKGVNKVSLLLSFVLFTGVVRMIVKNGKIFVKNPLLPTACMSINPSSNTGSVIASTTPKLSSPKQQQQGENKLPLKTSTKNSIDTSNGNIRESKKNS